MENKIKMTTTIGFWGGKRFDWANVIDNRLVSNVEVDYLRETGKLPNFELSDDMVEEIKRGNDYFIRVEAFSGDEAVLRLEYWASEAYIKEGVEELL